MACGGATLQEVGSVMGLSRERVRQIETAAFEKLRDELGPEIAEALVAEPGDGPLPLDMLEGPEKGLTTTVGAAGSKFLREHSPAFAAQSAKSAARRGKQ